jgi:hypothetical protein
MRREAMDPLVHTIREVQHAVQGVARHPEAGDGKVVDLEGQRSERLRLTGKSCCMPPKTRKKSPKRLTNQRTGTG